MNIFPKVKKGSYLFIFLIIISIFITSCASFGLNPATVEDAIEGRDYTIKVRAWDKKNPYLTVSIRYRINGGDWKEENAIGFDRIFQVLIDGSLLSPGYIDYEAFMTNSKGEPVRTRVVSVRILSLKEAREKKEKDYYSRLSDGGSIEELAYNENAEFVLRVRGNQTPINVDANIFTESGTKNTNVLFGENGLYAINHPHPHIGVSLSYQWIVVWQDDVFGEITTLWPSNPQRIAILDRITIRNRIDDNFRRALEHKKAVQGTWSKPPIVEASLNYTGLTERHSLGPRQVILELRKGSETNEILMKETTRFNFKAEIPVHYLENGFLNYTFKYSDNFEPTGPLTAWFSTSQNLKINYKSKSDMAKEKVSTLSKKFKHDVPENVVESKNLELYLTCSDSNVRVISASAIGVGNRPLPGPISFLWDGSSWYASLPGRLVNFGSYSYRIKAIVEDSVFGQLEVIIPENSEFFVMVAKE